MPIEWVVPAVALLLLVWAVIAHRRLVAMREVAAQVWSEIDAQFRQRQDLIPRLLQVVRSHHADPGQKAVQALTEARRAAAGAQSPAEIGRAEAALSSALDAVLAWAETQAGLAADTGFCRLRSEFQDMESGIEASRRLFDDTVEDYNAARKGFPAILLIYLVSLPPLEHLTPPKARPHAGHAVQRP